MLDWKLLHVVAFQIIKLLTYLSLDLLYRWDDPANTCAVVSEAFYKYKKYENTV